MNHIDACLSPSEVAALTPRRLRGVTCVVIDVLRATSAMIAALASGASAVLPVRSISEAKSLRQKHPDILLAGELNCYKIPGFDLGNSPREMTTHRVRNRTIAWITTNGTAALQACLGADAVYVASVLNFSATLWALAESKREILFVCAGTRDRFALEDAVCAGAMISRIPQVLTPSARMALVQYQQFAPARYKEALYASENGQRLLSIPSLAEDVSFCAEKDRFPLLAQFVRNRVIATSA